MALTKIKSKTGIEWHNAFSISADNLVNFIGDSSNSTWSKVANAWHNDDNTKVDFGTSSDLSIYHDGTDSYITNTPDTGHLIIKGDSIKLQDNDHGHNYLVATQDGSVDLYHNEIKTFSTDANGAVIYGPEGGSGNLYIYGDEGDDNNDKWVLIAGGGEFSLQNYASGSWEKSIECNGNGNVELYHDNALKLETVSDGVAVSGHVKLLDDSKVIIGTGLDLQLYHDGSHSYIDDAGTGSLYISTSGLIVRESGTNDNIIVASGGGGVSLYYDNSEKVRITSTGFKTLGNAQFDDDRKVEFGDGQDLQIYHDGSTGIFECTNSNLSIRPKTGENGILIQANGSVSLYCDDAKKLETASGGVTVTGLVDASCFTATDGTGYEYIERTPGNANIPVSTWTTIQSSYGWALPGAGTYLLVSSMRVRLWGVTGYINTRLYDTTNSAAVGATTRMMFEQADDASLINTQVTLHWVHTCTGAVTINQQFNTTNDSTNSSIQNDGNGWNYVYWQRIG